MSRSPVVLITGGASGIGRTMAQRFVGEGYDVHVCDVDATACEGILAELPGTTATVADVASVEDVDRVFDDLSSTYGRLDVLVNNAGIAGPTGRAENIDPDDWDKTIAVSLSAQFYCARKAIPMLRQASGGSIIIMSSNAAFFGFPLRLPYAAAKWALLGMTKSLAMELGPDGIRVNAICPGSVNGPRIERVIEKDAEERGLPVEEIRRLYSRQSSMRRFVNADDVANLACFLASEQGTLISGQAIGVDGHTEALSNWLE